MSTEILNIEGVAEKEGSNPISYRPQSISVTQYSGGTENGPMLQITIGKEYVGLTRSQALELANTIKNWL